MKKYVPIEDRLDEFNRVILDLQNIELKVEDKNQTLNLLCSLPSSYKCFIDNLLYGRDSLSSKDVKAFLKSRKLKKQVLKSYNDDHAKGLILSGRTNNKGLGTIGKSISNSISRKIKCLGCHKIWHF